jgi:hypothetical protein
VRRVNWRRAQRPLNHGNHLIVVDSSRTTRVRLVKQAITTILQKPAAPLANGMVVDAKFGSHRRAWQAVRTRIARHRSDPTGQHGDDELASPSTPVPADSAPMVQSAGLSSLHSPLALLQGSERSYIIIMQYYATDLRSR